MAPLNFTFLLCLCLALSVVASNPDAVGLHRRDHAALGRFMRKRMPAGSSPSAQTPSNSPAAQPTQGSSAVAQTTPENSAPSSQVASASASASPSATGGGLLNSVVDGLLHTSSATSSAESATETSTSSPSSDTPQTTLHDNSSPGATPTESILYLTSGSTPSPTQTSSSSSSSGMSHAAMTVLIVIAASVGAAVILWTIIRKWKFRPSSDFEGRMQPIDWQPGVSNEGGDHPGQRRPLSRASSFHSGSGVDDQMRGPGGGYGVSPLNPIPDHDFTAGPAHLAAVGGYADLARGPSPQPMMQESLGHAPSLNQPIQYDQYGVPLHHGYNGY